MPSAVHTSTVEQQQHAPQSFDSQPAPKKKFGTVFGSLRSRSTVRNSQDHPNSQGPSTTWRSVDIFRPYTNPARKESTSTSGRTSIATISFERDSTPVVTATSSSESQNTAGAVLRPTTSHPTVIDLAHDNSMKALDTNLPSSSRRAPVRMDTQDGPWSVSVAETPDDTRSYSLYVKIVSFNRFYYRFWGQLNPEKLRVEPGPPTHNLTLTRTSMELVELDVKLRQSHPDVKIPALPIRTDSLPAPPKRKSTFLNTLSRLASPTSSKSQRQASNSRRMASALGPTPLASPALEAGDPFASFGESEATTNGAAETVNTPTPPSATSTAIAAYLTTVSNLPVLRMDRVWKRFVRVRTDDLESVRVERAIKRVRSDLAAHVGIPSKEKENVKVSTTSEAGSVLEKSTEQLESTEEKTEEEEKVVEERAEEKEEGHPSKAANVTDSTMTQESSETKDATPSTEASTPTSS
ncbi:hypothetical protein NLJ89_g10655 [Agrocybe chaxingu]|uniref:Uncharacterized protein n=1 Tax=Agrocybe chaxingu TaxID=84603 RepID=A0A9W8JRC3_9AGAR|nr:hypothetical protein NLJ89_g10655 [Agrocybe chaxingu]